MNAGFQSLKIVTQWIGSGVPEILVDDFCFYYRNHLFRHAAGGYTDGLSSPALTHCLPDLDPKGWGYPAAIAHDGGYHDALEVLESNGEWVHFDFTKDECDSIFKTLLDLLADTPQKKIEAEIFYQAVVLGGQAAFDAGRLASRQMKSDQNFLSELSAKIISRPDNAPDHTIAPPPSGDRINVAVTASGFEQRAGEA